MKLYHIGKKNETDMDLCQIGLNEAHLLAKNGLLALSLTVGLKVLNAMMQQEVTEAAGEKGKHSKAREWYRHGTEDTSVVLAGEKAKIKKPRARKKDKSAEYDLEILKAFQNEDLLNATILKHMMLGISTRTYCDLQQKSAEIDTYGHSKSSVSGRFIVETQKGLEEFMQRRLEDSFPVIMIDGVNFGEYLLLVALGIKASGEKQVLGIREGSTENSHVCESLLEDLIERGLNTETNRLFVLDGSKALSKAVKSKFDSKCEIQRCQVHKKRNVEGHLPESERSWVIQKMNLAYSEFDYNEAKNRLLKLAKELEHKYPSASNSILEGLEETLTLHRLEIPGELRRSLCTTNAAESLMSSLRNFAGRVKKWENGNQVLRWVACGSVMIEPKFRRIKGYRQIPFLTNALNSASPVCQNKAVI